MYAHMYLQALHNVTPPNHYTQKACWDILRQASETRKLRAGSMALAEKVLMGDSGIEKRHFALRPDDALFSKDAEALNHAFEREAPKLATTAIEGALQKAEQLPANLDALIICTCTGYLCPGLTSYVAESLGIRNNCYLQDLVGLGCGAAIPSLRAAAGFLALEPKATVAVIAVEVCSAAFFLDDDAGVIISACLFGDGASASIWSNTHRPGALQASHFDTLHLPDQREQLRFTNQAGKLRNILKRSVPGVAAKAVAQLYERRDGEPDAVIVPHPGGRDVVEAITEAVQSTKPDASLQVLQNYGNMSSPSVLFVLEATRQQAPASTYWLTTFGAGFACHSCQLKAVD